MKRITAFLCAFVMVFTMCAQAAQLSTSTAIRPQYQAAYLFSEGFAAVKKSGKWGYIDETGKAVTKNIYDYAGSFTESKAIAGKIVAKNSVTENGKTRTAYDVQMFIVDTTGKETPFVRNGENFVCKDFDMTQDVSFYGGITVFETEGETVYFKHDGTVFPFTPKYIPTEGKMIFWNEEKPEDGINVTDMEGNIIFKKSGKADKNGYRTTRIYPFNQGLAMADIAKFDENGNVLEYGYGFINTEGKFVTLPYYRDFYRSGVNTYKIFNDGGLASVMKGGKYGAIDKNENTRIPFAYDKIFTFQEGLAPFMKGDKWGVMDIYGNIIVEAKYENITRFNGGLAIAHDGTKAIVIDRTGAEVKSLSNIDLSSYVQETKMEDGTVLISSNPPTDMLITKSGGSYGYTKLDFSPAMPTEKDADGWALTEVAKAIENKLVPAELQNIYRENITREDFAVLLTQFLETYYNKSIDEIVLDKTGKTIDNFINEYPFNDAFTKEIIGPYALGLINGNGAGAFVPCDYITRQDAASLLARLAKFVGDEKAEKVEAAALNDFKYVADYAKDNVKYVQTIKVMNGTGGGNFSPLGYYTKQQAFVTMNRLFEAVSE